MLPQLVMPKTPKLGAEGFLVYYENTPMEVYPDSCVTMDT